MRTTIQIFDNEVRLIGIVNDGILELDYDDIWNLRLGAELAKETPQEKPRFEFKSMGARA